LPYRVFIDAYVAWPSKAPGASVARDPPGWLANENARTISPSAATIKPAR
jgi:hypothetical protein